MVVRGCHRIGEQIGALPVGLFVVKGLIVWQGRQQRQHMDCGRHIRVSQADQLEIAGHGKNYRVGWRTRQRATVRDLSIPEESADLPPVHAAKDQVIEDL